MKLDAFKLGSSLAPPYLGSLLGLAREQSSGERKSPRLGEGVEKREHLRRLARLVVLIGASSDKQVSS